MHLYLGKYMIGVERLAICRSSILIDALHSAYYFYYARHNRIQLKEIAVPLFMLRNKMCQLITTDF